MKSRTIVKNVAQNSGGRSVTVFYFQFNMIVATISKRLLGFFADLLLFSELKLVCSIISVEAGSVCKSTVV